MKLSVFETPIWIGNIDAKKIHIKQDETKKETWDSKIETTFGKLNDIDKPSLDYMFDVIISLLDESISAPYSINLVNIWENYYKEDDFQEKHIHPGSDLSFIIYKKVEESRTIFYNPASNLMQCFYEEEPRKLKLLGNQSIKLACRQDQIVIFPSHIEHMVRKTSDAITIAGNLKLTFRDA